MALHPTRAPEGALVGGVLWMPLDRSEFGLEQPETRLASGFPGVQSQSERGKAPSRFELEYAALQAAA